MSITKIPITLCISGHDPVGGAGIQADIEAVAANGCHACSVITALTTQDTCHLHKLTVQPATELRSQLQSIIDDVQVAAIKIGLLGSTEIAHTIADFLGNLKPIPVILDPVLATGSGQSVANSRLLTVIHQRLLPQITLITPNTREAQLLAPHSDSLQGCARQLLSRGCGYVLITGTHEQCSDVTNRLYSPAGMIDASHWQRLPGEYHGSGCTLASAITARLALARCSTSPESGKLEQEMLRAVREGQAYTWRTLRHGFPAGHCQWLPNRLFQRRNQEIL